MNVQKRECFDIRLTKKESELLSEALKKLPGSIILEDEFGFDDNEIDILSILYDKLEIKVFD